MKRTLALAIALAALAIAQAACGLGDKLGAAPTYNSETGRYECPAGQYLDSTDDGKLWCRVSSATATPTAK